MNASHLRCFWRWPLGHRWEYKVDRTYGYRRCRECGKTKSLGMKDPSPPTGGYGVD